MEFENVVIAACCKDLFRWAYIVFQHKLMIYFFTQIYIFKIVKQGTEVQHLHSVNMYQDCDKLN
jgi:hypothetical protein